LYYESFRTGYWLFISFHGTEKKNFRQDQRHEKLELYTLLSPCHSLKDVTTGFGIQDTASA